jgi:hypothetical protein
VRGRIGSWLINVICGLLAYTGSRVLWGAHEDVFEKLHWELLTFAVFYLLMQALIRGWRLALKGRGPAPKAAAK